MTKSTHIKFAALLLAGLFSTGAMAQFVWIDAHGQKQFSDTPPPGDIPANHILKQPHRAAAAGVATAPKEDAAATADSGKDKEPPKTLADQNADFKKRKAEAAEKEKKKADEEKKVATKADNCKHAKEYLDTLKSGARIQKTDGSGERSYMSDDDRAKETDRAQSIASESCG